MRVVPLRILLISFFLLAACHSGSTSSNTGESPRTTKSLASVGAGTAVVAVQGCGNGVVETGEDCDGGTCCLNSCKFKPTLFVCDVATNTHCSGSSGACAVNSLSAGISYYDPAKGVCP